MGLSTGSWKRAEGERDEQKAHFSVRSAVDAGLERVVPMLRGPEGSSASIALLYGMDAYDGCATAAAIYYEQEEAREAV